MIDIEPDVFRFVKKAVQAVSTNAYVTGEVVSIPPRFPCVFIYQSDSAAMSETATSTDNENHAIVTFTADVYSNAKTGRKSECKAIMAAIDEMMNSMGFTRMMCAPMPNQNDATVYRMTARYRAAVNKKYMIFRR